MKKETALHGIYLLAAKWYVDEYKNAVSRCRNEMREFVFLCTVARNMRAIWVFMVHFCEKIASEQPVFFSGI